jgi:hypothetical protein
LSLAFKFRASFIHSHPPFRRATPAGRRGTMHEIMAITGHERLRDGELYTRVARPKSSKISMTILISMMILDVEAQPGLRYYRNINGLYQIGTRTFNVGLLRFCSKCPTNLQPIALSFSMPQRRNIPGHQDHEINPNTDYTSIASSACESVSSRDSRTITSIMAPHTAANTPMSSMNDQVPIIRTLHQSSSVPNHCLAGATATQSKLRSWIANFWNRTQWFHRNQPSFWAHREWKLLSDSPPLI